jgi:hypothetical protein
MKRRAGAIAASLLLLASCSTEDVADGVESAGRAVADAGDAVVDGVSSVPSLVNVNLTDVLNDLAVELNLDRSNIPINAQVPITIAANVCGVSINVLSVSTGGQAVCTAKTTSPELAQAVQQQVAAGGSVGGGDQSGSTASAGGEAGDTTTTAPDTADSGTSTGGAGTQTSTDSPTPSPTTTDAD